MTGCKSYIKAQIEKKGFLSIAEYMDIALYHPDFGYYMKKNPLGSHADFITASEVSCLFGETLGLWALSAYQKLGCPLRLALLELGPGRGTLMQDLLNIVCLDDSLKRALSLHLVEISPSLKSIQQDCLKHPQIFWYKTLSDALERIGDTPTLIIANEFFDALPIHQFLKTEEGWQERGIGLSEKKDLQFCDQFLKKPILPSIENYLKSVLQEPLKIIHEYCPMGSYFLKIIVDHISQFSGAALIIDYGYSQGYGDSLQAIKNHKYASVFDEPGDVDLTAHVNFGLLKQESGKKSRLKTQKQFLIEQGIIDLFKIRRHKALLADQNKIDQQFHKLTSSTEMGTLFKMLEISSFDK